MKITIGSATLLLAFLMNSVGSFAQSDDDYMRFESKGVDWDVNYKGKRYTGLSKKNTLIAQNCDCKEAEKLFQLARSKYIKGLSAFVLTIPVGFYIVDPSILNGVSGGSFTGGSVNRMMIGAVLGGAIIGSPIFVICKSNILGNKAVREFNKCIDSKGKD
jgi:hypothetical protein